jgi:hypothetical protein
MSKPRIASQTASHLRERDGLGITERRHRSDTEHLLREQERPVAGNPADDLEMMPIPL